MYKYGVGLEIVWLLKATKPESRRVKGERELGFEVCVNVPKLFDLNGVVDIVI